MLKATLKALALCAVGVAAAAPFSVAQAQEPAPTGLPKWEYRILTREQVAELGKNDIAAGLNRLGDDGWQLVTIEPAVSAEKDGKAPGHSAQFYFQRPKDYVRMLRAGIQQRFAAAKSNVEMWEDRLAWTERMVRKGFLTANQARADEEELKRAKAAFDQVEREMKDLRMPEKLQMP
jgi:hypothetical protein